ncbi:MAG: hypothetical protein JU82_03565 [Sulfuricurvum sp. MLSB]|uniref:hypothetical protein n=1 Tax=unclassified Sulfuricurvum TaxID=2632390 RepID=UPI000505A2E0|nr:MULTISPECIES: hypothetical protein [unclassified Sulfuricurvum]KFN40361.1 MAG: hypothetical protein JU82_03565 [Sulfuricurvum sp. MLSB]
MSSFQNELHEKQEKLLARLKNLSVDHLIVAKRAKMSMREILSCLEISDKQNMALDFVFSEMEAFKQTAAHILYKEDFSLA